MGWVGAIFILVGKRVGIAKQWWPVFLESSQLKPLSPSPLLPAPFGLSLLYLVLCGFKLGQWRTMPPHGSRKFRFNEMTLLYRGKVGLDVAEAQHLMDGLDWQGAVKDIQASVQWLKANGSQMVGVTGFCMGGALTIASSVLSPGVDAAVAFYGVPPPELADPAQAKAPLQAHFGEVDSFVGFSDVKTGKVLEEKLKASGVPHEVHFYPGVGHAFMNRSPDGVKRRKHMGMTDDNEAAAELAWSRFQSWMSCYLSP